MEKQMQNPYMVPAAIVIAGLIIAGAVVYSGGLSGDGNLTGNGGLDNAVPTGGGVVTPVQAADAIGLNKKDFEKCVTEKRGADAVNADLEGGVNAGIGGTPASVLVTKSGEQYFLSGALPADLLDEYVAAAIADDTVKLTELEGQYGVPPVTDVPALGDGDHLSGSIDAPVVLIEYSDLQCPFCKSFHPTIKQVLGKYGDKVAWAYRHFPLEALHPSARPLAEGSECADQLGGNVKFWEYIDYVLES